MSVVPYRLSVELNVELFYPERGFRLICVCRNLSDTGMYIQTIMLAARGFGLHTCPQAAWISFQEPVFKHLEIPEDQMLVSGMAIGYADESAIENTLVSEREDIANVAYFRGFD